MGQGNSAERQRLKDKNVRYYRPPESRQKDRFEAFDNTIVISSDEAGIDKFDYLLVFPLTEGPYVSPVAGKDAGLLESRIEWVEIERIWRQAAMGTDEMKQKSIDGLKEYWKNRIGSPPRRTDTIRTIAWYTIAREALVHTYTKKTGLQMKLSANKRFIFCRVRAPIKLLELQADKENYRLEFRGEIDPGSEEFFNLEIPNPDKDADERTLAVEVEEEKKLYSKDEANAILEKLYKAQKISPNDLVVNQAKEGTDIIWSRRVHALERIADRVPIWNRYPAYAPFSTDPYKRYMYNVYPSVRGKTLFRAKDRIYLTKCIIDQLFDLEVLVANGVLNSMMALHDSNRGEKLTIDILQRRWVQYWRVTAKECGSPLVTDKAYHEDVELLFLYRPFAQPLIDIREYFGEKIALFYAWLGFYTIWQFILGIFAGGMLGIYAWRGVTDGWNSDYDGIDWYLIGFAIIGILWSQTYCLCWNREEKAIAAKWGTRGFEEEEVDRPQFRGDPNEPLARSFVNNRLETNYPDSLRYPVMTWSYIVVIFLVLLDLGVYGGILYGHSYLVNYYSDYNFTWMIWAVAVVIAIVIRLASLIFLPIARGLTDNENHRTETNYEDEIITKILIFDLINNYAVVLFTAFLKDWLLNSCDKTYGCIYDLRVLLFATVIARAFFELIPLITPYIWFFYVWIFLRTPEPEEEELIGDADDDTQYMKEVDLSIYEGTVQEYSESVFQYGYITLFNVALPMIVLVTLGENLLKIRMSAWKLCSLSRRPHVFLAEDVGRWQNLMDVMNVFGAIVSVAIVVFVEKGFDDYSLYSKIVIFLVSEQILLFMQYLLTCLISDEPEWVSDCAKRQEFIAKKFAEGYEDNDDDLDMNKLKGTISDTIDVDGMNIYDISKAKPKTEDEYTKMDDLEQRRRDMLKEIKVVKDQLQSIFKTENFNELTGVGETKHGLPLGRLTVKLIQLENFSGPELKGIGATPKVKIRVTIKGRKGGPPAGPPINAASDSKVLTVVDGSAQINQSMGPYAPIRTQDADLCLDIIEVTATSSSVSLATTSIYLRDLQDQKPRDMIIDLKIRAESGALIPSNARIFLNVCFQYSKLVPVRNKIYEHQDKLRRIEKELARLKAGQFEEKDEKWDD